MNRYFVIETRDDAEETHVGEALVDLGLLAPGEFVGLVPDTLTFTPRGMDADDSGLYTFGILEGEAIIR